MEGFRKKVIPRQGFEACIGVCVKRVPTAEDSELVAEGIGIGAEPGNDIKYWLGPPLIRMGNSPRAPPARSLGWGVGVPEGS